MTVVLSVDRPAWQRHVASTVAAHDGAVTAVVKGNGYGFGRSFLSGLATEFGIRSIAVGSARELAGTERFAGDVVALTPTLDSTDLFSTLASNAVLTIGSSRHVEHLRSVGYRARVAVKLRSSMQRYGFSPLDLPPVETLGPMTVHAYMIHLPIAGSMAEHIVEIEAWLPLLDPSVTLSVSHLDAPTFAGLRTDHPDRSFSVRLGTVLWHGDTSALRVQADVLDVHDVKAGETVGYRATSIEADGTIVLIGAGSAHGVVPLDNGLSPFHFVRKRMTLVEAPHMHTSIAFIPSGGVVPEVGDSVDVQRPLTMTNVDHIDWHP